jgi:nucleotide sugar dehydrogenase
MDDNKLNKVSIIGLGRLGLCQALTFERAGCNVLGCDVSAEYVATINSRTLQSSEPGVEEALRSSSQLRATTSLAECVDHSALLFILVATPTGLGDHAYDCGTLSRLLEDIAALRRPGKHVVIGCTVLPGYIANVGSALLADCEGCTLSYNPEFIAQGEILSGLAAPELVLIGEGSEAAGDALEALYARATSSVPVVCRMSPASAEIAKLALNCFITAKISFANMVADIADRTPRADKNDILRALGADGRIGPRCLRPGYGFGGPCFPRDNRALGSYARAVGVEPHLCDATDAANRQHSVLMAEMLLTQGLERYVIADVAFKPGCRVDVIEESQPLEVAKLLARAGKRVAIRDRAAIIALVRRTYGRLFEYETTDDAQRAPPPNLTMGNPHSSYQR